MTEINLSVKHEVEILQNLATIQHRKEELSAYLKEQFSNASPSLPEFLGKDLNELNVIMNQETKEIGYEFVFPKMHKDFFIMEGDTFRYRHDEVIEIIEKAIDHFDLKNEIDYDRGLGMFIYDIWEKLK